MRSPHRYPRITQGHQHTSPGSSGRLGRIWAALCAIRRQYPAAVDLPRHGVTHIGRWDAVDTLDRAVPPSAQLALVGSVLTSGRWPDRLCWNARSRRPRRRPAPAVTAPARVPDPGHSVSASLISGVWCDSLRVSINHLGDRESWTTWR